MRTFSYDAAGRMAEATVFTLTTSFHYNGDGARVAVTVAGQGTTTYTLDYAGDERILAEVTAAETKRYLYGQAAGLCLGEETAAGWSYYLPDAEGQVRQVTDEVGTISSAWLYDPEGTVLEGPAGPVSHLVCGGVYDWSTGLIYKGGRYFDPSLGIWLAMTPLAVIQLWSKGKRKQGHVPWYGVLLVMIGAGSLVVACSSVSEQCVEGTPVGGTLGDNALFLDPGCCNLPSGLEVKSWEQEEREMIKIKLNEVIINTFGGSNGFGSWQTALTEFGVSTQKPILLIRDDVHPQNSATGAAADKPFLYIYDNFENADEFGRIRLLTHEMAHYWDQAKEKKLRSEMQEWINWGEPATTYGARSISEDFAEAVTVYLHPNSNQFRDWTDDYYKTRGTNWPDTTGPDQLKIGTEQVRDRYDYVECKFGKIWKEGEKCP